MAGDVKLVLKREMVERYMEERGWSLRRMAQEMNVDHSYVCRVLRGKQEPGRKFIEGLIRACQGMDFFDLFFFETLVPRGTKGDASEENHDGDKPDVTGKGE